MAEHETALQRDVQAELAAEPGLDAGRLQVSASSGAVTLTGTVDSYFEKALAEAVALRAIGGIRRLTDTGVKQPTELTAW